MKEKCLVIYNPKAGKKIFNAEMNDVIVSLSKKYEVTIIPTTHKGHFEELVKEKYMNFDIIVICGGDGSISEVVECVTKNNIKTKIGVMPSGSTNDFSKNLYKCKKLEEVADVICKNKVQDIDIFQINDKAITYVAGFGPFTDLSYSTPQDLKNMLGYGGYIVSAINKISEIDYKKIKINYIDENNEHKTREDEVFVCLFANSKQIAGFESPSSSIMELNDGCFECILVKTLNDKTTINNLVEVIKMKEAEIVINEKAKWTIDGEYGGDFDKAKINLRTKIQIFVE